MGRQVLQSIGRQVINKVDTRVLASYLCTPLLLAGMTRTVPAGRFDWLHISSLIDLTHQTAVVNRYAVSNNKT